MSWAVVAGKEVRDASRSRSLWAVTVLALAVVAGGVYLPTVAFERGVTARQALAFLSAPARVVMAITALSAAYLSIAGERESGSIKLLLGLPHTRRDVVLGKLIGRVAVVVVALALAFVAAAAILRAEYGSVPIGAFGRLFLLTLLYTSAFTGFAVGVSAATPTRARAMATVVGAFVLFEFAWGWVPRLTYHAVRGAFPGEQVPAWYVLLERLSPAEAYRVASSSFLDPGGRTITVSSGGASGDAGAAAVPLAERVIGDLPMYLQPELAPVVLVAWLLVVPFLGYLHFRSVDL